MLYTNDKYCISTFSPCPSIINASFLCLSELYLPLVVVSDGHVTAVHGPLHRGHVLLFEAAQLVHTVLSLEVISPVK